MERGSGDVPAAHPRATAERLLYISAAVGIVLLAMRYTAPILGPFLLVCFFAILFTPIYTRLRTRGLGAAISLIIIGVLLMLIGVLLAGIIAGSIASLLGNTDEYQRQLSGQIQGVQRWLAARGFDPIRTTLQDIADPATVINLVRSLLSIVMSVATNFVYVALAILFLLADGPRMIQRVRDRLGRTHPVMERFETFAPATIRYFGLRSMLNALTGAGVGIGLFILGIDFALLWALLMFLLNYIPYIGIFLAAVPPVLLALVEYGFGRAIIVVAMITAWNMILENLIMPRVAGRQLKLTPFVVYISFFFWSWVIGPIGALLSVFLTQFTVLVLETFPETRGIALLAMHGEIDSENSSSTLSEDLSREE